MKKILFASVLALFFVACNDKTTTTVIESSGLTKDTAKEIKVGYQVKPLGKASFEIEIIDGKRYVTLTSGKAIIEKI